jgi:hypothetical protein
MSDGQADVQAAIDADNTRTGPPLAYQATGGNNHLTAEGRMDVHELISVPGFWYLATPYSKYPAGIVAAFEEACHVSAWLIRQGVRIYCPIAHTHPIAMQGGIDPHDHAIWLPVDKPFMEAACGLIVTKMSSWQDSYGIQCEIAEMDKQDKPVRYMAWPQP